MVVTNFLETFKTWLPLENIDNVSWIQRQWVEMFLKKCASVTREVRKKRRRGNKRPAIELGECVGKKMRRNLAELPNTPFMVVIRRVQSGNNDETSSIQLQASYTNVRHWE
jgi:hypothetical protein